MCVNSFISSFVLFLLVTQLMQHLLYASDTVVSLVFCSAVV